MNTPEQYVRLINAFALRTQRWHEYPFDVERWQLEGAECIPMVCQGWIPTIQRSGCLTVIPSWQQTHCKWPSPPSGLLLADREDENMELSDEARQWIARCADLAEHVAEDGIVCLPSVRGDKAADTRLLDMLIDAWESVEPGSWKASILDKLLADADCAGKGLDVWLRDRTMPSGMPSASAPPLYMARVGRPEGRLRRAGELPQARHQETGTPHPPPTWATGFANREAGVRDGVERCADPPLRRPRLEAPPGTHPRRRTALRYFCALEEAFRAAHRLEPRSQ